MSKTTLGPPPTPPIRWAAQLQHVREVSLQGTAELAWWQPRLNQVGLEPVGHEGKAQILIFAADGRFAGIRFRELSFSVLARGLVRGSQQDGAFLLQAYNSQRLLAWSERVLFSTPYSYGDVQVRERPSPAIAVSQRGEPLFQAQMGNVDHERAPERSQADGWEGPVFLPAPQHPPTEHPWPGVSSKWFMARIQGATDFYPFRPKCDVLTIARDPRCVALRALLDSDFRPQEWIVRPDATHAKSKTYRRSP